VSLSTFVERKDVKEYLRLNVPKPWFQVKAEIKAPPLTTAYGWAGTSLDYLLRFYLQKLNTCAKESGWVAEESLAILERSRVAPSALKRARGIVAKARQLHRAYLKEKGAQKPSEELVRAAIDLAQLDFFEKKIRPVLSEQCYKCHSATSEKLKGGLRLDSRDAMLKGGDTGPAVAPGDFRHVSPRADLNDQLFLLLPCPPGARPGDALAFDRRRLARGIGSHRAYPGHR